MIREARMLIYQAFFSVFPIYTGVIPKNPQKEKNHERLPHIYGGDSHSEECKKKVNR